MSEPATHSASVCVAATHPALPGHFPGRPVVPGVVLLDEVVNAAEAWLHTTLHVRSLQQAKFTAPLLPDQSAELRLTLQGSVLKFVITRAADAIARGVFEVAPEAAPGKRA